MKRKWTTWIALLLAVLLPLTILAEKPTVSTTNPLTFSTTTLYGKPIDSSILKKYDLIMVNFWAEWCGPCVSELPALEKIHQNYGNVLVLGAYVDINTEGAIAAAENAGVTYPLFKVPYNFYDYIIISGGSFSIPQTCFFNSKGYQLNDAYIGSRYYDSWVSIVEELLAHVDDTYPTAEPTVEPTPTPTAPPTEEPTPTPTAPPTEEPTPTVPPTEEPSDVPPGISTPEPPETPTVPPAISKPVIKTQPKNVSVKAGKKATFKIKAKGEELKYQWYYRTSSAAKWKKVSSGGKSATLSFKAKAKQNGYQYRCLVKNSAGKVYSKTVRLKVKK